MNFLGVDITRETQHDGSVWKKYTTPSGVVLTVSKAFQELMERGDPNVLNDHARIGKRLLGLIHRYREAFEGKYYDEIRDFMIKGGEAEFFCLGDTNLGIREVLDGDMDQKRNTRNLGKMFKMDVIDHLLNLGCIPRWIKTPHHYAMLNIPMKGGEEDYSKNFMLIEKIDHGVTVKDIIAPRNTALHEAILREFGTYFGFTTLDSKEYMAFKGEVEEKYAELVIRLKAAFLEHKPHLPAGLKFEDIFTDLFERNVLITYNATPIGGSRISFWIIDQ